MLRPDIREFISFSTCPNLDDNISRAWEREINLEHIGKRKAEHGYPFGAAVKKPKGFDSRSKRQYGRSHCGKYDIGHDGV